MSEGNGAGKFRINDLVNKLVPFRLEYDGFVLEGQWWKYRTTTPAYAKKFLESLPQVPEEGTDDEKQKAQQARSKALEEQSAQVLADTIESWNAVDEDDQPLPINAETFNQLPEPFIEFFASYFKGLREETAAEKKSQPSPSTS